MKLGILGTGAVTAAGWRTQDFIDCCLQRTELPTCEPTRTAGPARQWTCRARVVPGPAPAELLPKSPRLRRASPLTKFQVVAATQALNAAGLSLPEDGARLGVIQVLQNGCVQYSVRFFAELQVQPSLPSPIIFPETVFNAPASHVAQCLGVNGMVTTLIGEPNLLVEAAFTAQQWIAEGLIDHCLIVASEEIDWMTAEALSYYDPRFITTEGAGAILLGPPTLGCAVLSDLSPLVSHHGPHERKRVLEDLALHAQKSGSAHALISHFGGIDRIDRSERAAWQDWSGPRHSPRAILGDALGASSALQWVLAAHLATASGESTLISMPGATASAVARMEAGA
jgi:3-oxoacyl-[acyl-carrier-protein] synthase II